MFSAARFLVVFYYFRICKTCLFSIIVTNIKKILYKLEALEQTKNYLLYIWKNNFAWVIYCLHAK